jgi:transposase-like protein
LRSSIEKIYSVIILFIAGLSLRDLSERLCLSLTLAVYASKGRGIPSAIEFLRKVLDSCEGKPVIVVDRGPWYRWALDRLGIIYFHETLDFRK